VSPALPSLTDAQLGVALEQCGMTAGVARAVLGHRPFPDDAALYSAVDAVILNLDDEELTRALDAVPPPAAEHGHPDARTAALLAIRLYRDRFGYAFVSGIDAPTAEELLMRVRIRLGNDPEPEGRAAREHLRRAIRARVQAFVEQVD
jgi:2-oxo-4-hydroxy-4-carboxy-5-ureidoimidazoline decarboxylase